MTKFKFSRESLQNVLANERERLNELLEENFQEGKIYLKNFFKLDVNWTVLLELEKLGNLAVYSVRTREGYLVGYAMAYAENNVHHQTKIVTNIDPIFISKKYRSAGVGIKFMKWLVNDMKKHNVDCVAVAAKMGHSFNKLLSRLKFTPVDTKYLLVLNEGTK